MKLEKETIDRIFDAAKEQADYVIGLYRIAFPDWDRITSLSGYPKVSDATGEYIMRKAIAFDQKNHRDVLAGGCWMNRGFSHLGSEHVPDWTIDTTGCKVSY